MNGNKKLGEWLDESTYSQSIKVQVPWCWMFRTNQLKISVHRHKDFPGKWLLSCYELNFSFVEMPDDLEAAKTMALETIFRHLSGMLGELTGLMAELPPPKEPDPEPVTNVRKSRRKKAI